MPYRLAIAQQRTLLHLSQHFPAKHPILYCKGGYRDSNPGPPEPQSGALTNCAIPTIQDCKQLCCRCLNPCVFHPFKKEMCSKGFEPPTHGLEGRCSIQLSYEHICSHLPVGKWKAGDGNRTHVSSLEGWCSTIELHPHISRGDRIRTCDLLVPNQAL